MIRPPRVMRETTAPALYAGSARHNAQFVALVACGADDCLFIFSSTWLISPDCAVLSFEGELIPSQAIRSSRYVENYAIGEKLIGSRLEFVSGAFAYGAKVIN